MTGRPVVGLVLALIVESAHWTRLRWEFNDLACIRAWHLSAVAIAVTTALIWLEGNRYTALPRLLGWLPPLLLPVQFVQSFGMRRSMPLNTFSFFARQRRARNARLGLEEDSVHFNFGNVYLMTAMVSSTLGTNADRWLFLPGLLILTGWALFHRRAGRPLHLIASLVVAGLIAVAGQVGLNKAYDWLTKGGLDGRDSFLDPNHYRTAIGRLGEIKLSPTILWRLRPAPGTLPPAYLRTAGYDRYSSGIWSNSERSVNGQPISADEIRGRQSRRGRVEHDFTPLVSREPVKGEDYWLVRPEAGLEAIAEDLPRFSIRGNTSSDQPLPLPGDAASLTGFEHDGIERNSLGTVRIFPKESVIDFTVLWRDQGNPEVGPDDTIDLRVGERERDSVSRHVRELGLDRQPDLKSKLDLLRGWFVREFEYSLYLSIQQPGFESNRRPTAIAKFLDETRRGHCEYFATAAALMLREVGVPARYAIGYAVMERDARRGEHVVRGVHGHAWCRVWDDARNRWVDFDPTPPGWLAMETRESTLSQRIYDGFQRLREDFFIWRGRAENRLAVTLVFALIGSGGLIFILRRLWKSRRRIAEPSVASTWRGRRPSTALHTLEGLIEQRLGPRPPGLTFSHWIAGLATEMPEPHLLDDAIRLHQRLRFDPYPTPSDLAEQLRDLVTRIRSALATPGTGTDPRQPV